VTISVGAKPKKTRARDVWGGEQGQSTEGTNWSGKKRSGEVGLPEGKGTSLQLIRKRALGISKGSKKNKVGGKTIVHHLEEKEGRSKIGVLGGKKKQWVLETGKINKALKQT